MPTTKRSQWEKIAVFSFGVLFLGLLVALVIFLPKLTPETYTVFRIAIALAAAGIGTAIPGFLDVEVKGLVRAGGAMALFVIVFFFSPAPPTPVDVEVDVSNLSESPDNTVKEWLTFIDGENYRGAWQVSAKIARASYNEKAFIDVFDAQRKPQGQPVDRVLYGVQALSALPSGQRGNFRLHTFRTKFSSGQEFLEGILVKAEDDKWRVYNHNIIPAPK